MCFNHMTIILFSTLLLIHYVLGHLLINILSAQDVLHVYIQLLDVFNVIHLRQRQRYVVSAFCQWVGLDIFFGGGGGNHTKTSKLTLMKLNPQVDKWGMSKLQTC